LVAGSNPAPRKRVAQYVEQWKNRLSEPLSRVSFKQNINGECRWNYITTNDQVAGSNPARITFNDPVAQW
jgi:hypothetical protein